MTAADVGLLAVRVAVGTTFTAHGAQKVLGWWEGPGFAKWSAGVTRMGLRPAWLWAAIAAGVEVVCGPLLVLGLLTPLASALLVAQSLYIVLRVHLPRGFFSGKGGIEFPLQLLAGSLLLAATGPGQLALDPLVGLDLGRTARIVLLVVAVAGVIVAMAIARPRPAPPAKPAA
jgi:putative oxidoreductase